MQLPVANCGGDCVTVLGMRVTFAKVGGVPSSAAARGRGEVYCISPGRSDGCGAALVGVYAI
jgi:hypothetical protein